MNKEIEVTWTIKDTFWVSDKLTDREIEEEMKRRFRQFGLFDVTSVDWSVSAIEMGFNFVPEEKQ